MEKDPKNRREPRIHQAGEDNKAAAPFSTLHFPEESIPIGAKEKSLPLPYRPWTAGGKGMNEKSLREPGLGCKQFSCSLVVKDFSWTFFFIPAWCGFPGLCGIQRAILSESFFKTAYLFKKQTRKSSQGGFSTPWLKVKVDSYLLTFWQHL